MLAAGAMIYALRRAAAETMAAVMRVITRAGCGVRD